jgi:hypothetical protein
MCEFKNDALNQRALFHLLSKVIRLVVELSGKYLLAIIGDEDLTHGTWTLAVVAALFPERTTLGNIRSFHMDGRLARPTLKIEETKIASIT